MKRFSGIPAVVLTLTALVFASGLLAQHSFTPEEVADGGRIYGASCSGCHGPKGDAVSGVALMSGTFKRATSDDDLARLVRNGIPNTPMQAQRDINDMQAATVVAYLRLMSLSSATASSAIAIPVLPPGDAGRGKILFENSKGNCLSCHRVGSSGSRFGPELTSIGAPPRGGAPVTAGAGRGGAATPAAGAAPPLPPAAAPAAAGAGSNPQTLAAKLLEPNASMTAANRYVRLVEKNGNVVAGKLLNEDTFAIQIFDSREKLSTYPKSNLKDYTYVSPMPSYRDKLNSQELSDVITYLISLKGN
jgi:mono/diheme cytochrome c family protein